MNREKAKKIRLNSAFKYHFGGMRNIVLERDNWQCVECGLNQEQHILLFGRGLTVDHIDGTLLTSTNTTSSTKSLTSTNLIKNKEKETKKVDVVELVDVVEEKYRVEEKNNALNNLQTLCCRCHGEK